MKIYTKINENKLYSQGTKEAKTEPIRELINQKKHELEYLREL